MTSSAPSVDWNSRSTRASRRSSASAAMLRVDLGLLELARVVDVDRLPLGEEVERGLTRLAVPVARVLDAAEREVHLGADRAGVDVRDAGLEVAHRAEGAVDVLREDRGREAVLDAIRDLDRLVDVAHLDHRGRRAEDLLLGDPHLRVDVAEDRWPIVEAILEAVPRGDLPAREERRA